MKLEIFTLDLAYKHTFGISRWAYSGTTTVFVTVEHDGIVGIGEGAPNRRYGETIDTSVAFLKSLNLGAFESPNQIEAIMQFVNQRSGNFAAKAALDIALHDWWGKKEQKPLYQLFGIERPKPLLTSYTIGIDEPEVMQQKVREAPQFHVLKIKVGTENDAHIIKAIREVTQVPLRVDANEGWKTKEEALANIVWLAWQGVELVEQPLPANRLKDIAWLRARSPLPLIADEDCTNFSALPNLSNAYDGINVKLDKSGGLLEARKMFQQAKQLGMTTMIGCMGSSSVSITAGAHLAQIVDIIDLDGNLLLKDDPYSGVQEKGGYLYLNGASGLGVEKIK